MAYKSILVHADQSQHAAARMTLAVQLAVACRAHLTALACSGLSRYASPGALPHQAPQVPERLDQWRAQARASLDAFATIAERAGLGATAACLLDDDPEAGLMQRAPFSDVVVLSQTDPEHAVPGAIRDLPKNLLLHCGRPLLLVPCHDSGRHALGAPFQQPLVAWDGSRHAARAIADALPLLKLASTVTLLVLNAEQHPAGHGMEVGADMALLLARHGVAVQVVREYTSAPIGDALLCVADELSSDLLVMGGYGHRRTEELLLGGATHRVLADMSLPVLIAH